MTSFSMLVTQTPQVLTPDLFPQVSLEPIWGRLYALHPTLESYDLSREEFSLGRSLTSNCVIDKCSLPQTSNSISRTHFVIKHEPGSSIKITDLSKYGTFINGHLIGRGTTVNLQNDDKISIGLKNLNVFVFKTIQSGQQDTYLPTELRHSYDVLKELGKGACGEVKLIVNKFTHTKYAVKKVVIGENALSDLKRITNEIKILKSIKHQNVISTQEIVRTDKAVFIVLEYMEGGELTSYIEEGLSEEQVKFIFYQIVRALEYLHNQGIVHRDLKPQNILLKEKQPKAIVKITDFGLSKIISEHTAVQTICGTLAYVAPEVLATNRVGSYTQAVDIWSLGVLLHYMLSKQLPFHSNEKGECIRKILNSKLIFTNAWVLISSNARDIVRKMLVRKPQNRITLSNIFAHPWLAEDDKITDWLNEMQETVIIYDSESESQPKRLRLTDDSL